jgi:hypothetical protein
LGWFSKRGPKNPPKPNTRARAGGSRTQPSAPASPTKGGESGTAMKTGESQLKASLIKVDEVISAAEGLLPSANGDIQQDLGYLSHRYHCEEILVLAKSPARELLRKVVQDDFARGFDHVQVTSRGAGGVPFVQLNLANSTYMRRTPGGNQSVRLYRVVKRDDGQFALYGHLALYEANRAMDPAHSVSFPRTTEGLTKELLTIGTVEEGLLPPQGSELRGRIESIGVSLNARGGKELMLTVHAVVRENLGSARARELERAWDGVGDWEG